jgi:enoyl-CoA hydratase
MESPVAISDLAAVLHSAQGVDELSAAFDTPYLLIDLDGWKQDQSSTSVLAELPQPICPVIALIDAGTDLPPIVDLVASSASELEMLTGAISGNPVAATILVQLLRHNEQASVYDGLFAESLSYSCLQNGVRFKAWLAQRREREQRDDIDEDVSSLVLMERQLDQLTITLNRPHKRNAYSAGLRDALYEALALVAADDTITTAVVQGAGECFSAGGDLDEFGAATDGAYAHVVRMTRSTGRLLHQLKSRTKFHLHGACIGAGIELPSFSDYVVAAPGSFFQLPEVTMGLIPGAGGTVSILRRIGRIRTAFMAISNQRISAETALEWGLINEIR